MSKLAAEMNFISFCSMLELFRDFIIKNEKLALIFAKGDAKDKIPHLLASLFLPLFSLSWTDV